MKSILKRMEEIDTIIAMISLVVNPASVISGTITGSLITANSIVADMPQTASEPSE